MYDISCPPGRSSVSKSIYDRQLDTDLFKRLHATRFTLAPKRKVKILGPGSYNPLTIEEIFRQKSCSKYGPFYQQSERFPSAKRRSKHLCNTQTLVNGLSNIPDEMQRKREFERRFNAIRLDRQSHSFCHQRRELLPRAPPVTLYEKSRIYGPYVKLAENRHYLDFPDWYKGPARLEDRAPPSILEHLFSSSNRHKGKFLPLSSDPILNRMKSSPGPTTYFLDPIPPPKPSLGFLSTTKRFPNTNSFLSHVGPAAYKPQACLPSCSKRKKK